MSAKSVTTATFQADVLDNPKPVMVDFWAEWCGPCRMVSPILDEIAAEYSDKIDIVKVNVDEEPELAMKYGVTGIPMMAVFQGGAIAKQMVGARPKDRNRRGLSFFPGIARIVGNLISPNEVSHAQTRRRKIRSLDR
jgi:thioredoxin 1